MMRILRILIALLSTLAVCTAGGGSQGKTVDDPSRYPEMREASYNTVTLDLDANITTGLSWSVEILTGDSVRIDSDASGYVSDPNPDLMDGVGGTEYYKLDAVASGDTLFCFRYGAGRDDTSAFRLYALVSVDEDMLMRVYDVSELYQ